MEGQLVQKTFTLDNIDLDCWVIKTDCKFWFNAHDIAVFLGYQNPNQAVRCNVPSEERKQWDELSPAIAQLASLPLNWQPNTVLISKGGLYRLLCRSTKPEAFRFEKLVFDDVLLTLRETGQYQLEKSFREQLAIKDKELVKIRDKVLEL
jgi:prophage antirepressor-like protein